MLKDVWRGIVAGALGTLALNVTTYVDMSLRGRASSGAPAKLVTSLAQKAGLKLADSGQDQEKVAQNRASGLGALLGYLTGLAVGGLYGLLRAGDIRLPLPVAGVGVGLTAMAASDTPLVAFGISDPKKWGVSGWASDILPHLVYGIVTSGTYEALG
ncbi:MAG TPA: hypothetical protein VH186_15095 [Chloroflexia bacterium]|nr:hypothetical protein [Chloroflexia bacterium]